MNKYGDPHEALRIFDSGRDCCCPRSASPCEADLYFKLCRLLKRSYPCREDRAPSLALSSTRLLWPLASHGDKGLFSCSRDTNQKRIPHFSHDSRTRSPG